MSFPVSGPVPAESNPPIAPQYFQPSAFTITAISFGVSTVVTTAPAFGVDNNYVIGQLVRLLIPSNCGATGLNNQEAYVIALPGENQVTLNINTLSGYNAFVAPADTSPSVPQIIALGDTNTGTINSTGLQNTGTTIPGAFINISPF